jgi:ribokinase
MSTVHVIGNLTWDRLIEVPSFPEPNRDYLIVADAAHAGGAGGNVAAGLSLLGLASTIVAAVGSDERGADLVAEISTYGVDTSHIQRVERMTSEFLCIIDPHGNRSFLLHPEQAAFSLDGDQAPYADGDSYAFVGCTLASAIKTLERASPQRRHVFANIGFWAASRELTRESLPALDRIECVFLNSDEFTELPEPVREFLSSADFLDEHRRVIITGGAAEAIAVTAAGSVALAPNRAPEVINTLGCGDAFMAGYLAAHLAGLEVQRCLAIAHDCAGRVAASPFERYLGQFDGIEVG